MYKKPQSHGCISCRMIEICVPAQLQPTIMPDTEGCRMSLSFVLNNLIWPHWEVVSNLTFSNILKYWWSIFRVGSCRSSKFCNDDVYIYATLVKYDITCLAETHWGLLMTTVYQDIICSQTLDQNHQKQKNKQKTTKNKQNKTKQKKTLGRTSHICKILSSSRCWTNT